MTVLMYSVFELCRIICSQIVLKDLDHGLSVHKSCLRIWIKNRRVGRMVDARHVKTFFCSKLCVCNYGSERNLCLRILDNLAWYISGNKLKSLPVRQFSINGRDPREVCRKFAYFSPANILLVYARKRM